MTYMYISYLPVWRSHEALPMTQTPPPLLTSRAPAIAPPPSARKEEEEEEEEEKEKEAQQVESLKSQLWSEFT